jgi:hypothetical protein
MFAGAGQVKGLGAKGSVRGWEARLARGVAVRIVASARGPRRSKERQEAEEKR